MQPILAESAPHRGRAVALAVVLAVVASAALLFIPGHHRPRHRDHRALQLQRIGRCAHTSYLYLVR